jgi:putative transport protein
MWHGLIETLIANPLLLLFLVAAIGYPLGLLRVGDSSLGVAAVLFVGLAFGALDQNLKLPEIIYQFGLVLFVYTIGLSSGPGFFRALRRRGLRDNALIAVVLVFAFALTVLLARVFALPATQAAGLFAGSLTNTPALAGVIEYIKGAVSADVRDQLATEPVVGYSIAYPIGVLGMILAIQIAQRLARPDYPAEARKLRDLGASGEELLNWTLRVTNPQIAGSTIESLARRHRWHVVFARQRRGDAVMLVNGATRLAHDDMISVIGTRDELELVVTAIGELVDERLDFDRSTFDHRRIFVSSSDVIGRRIDELDLQNRFGALITRVRRGDIELLANGAMILEPGDRVRVVALRERMREVSEFMGDSYRALSEIDVLTFSLGLVLGLLLGLVPIPLPGGTVFRLGIAGGPLLVSLLLGYLERTGPLVWSMPYSANLTLRQFGLVIFLAGIGTRAGFAFVNTLFSTGGVLLFATGALITCLTATVLLWIGHRLLRIPMSLLIGMLAGLQTNPAVLSFANTQTKNDLPNIGYATVYPVAMIGKIVLAQIVLVVLTRG